MIGRRSGMTLLEVVVALTIAATALSAGAATLGFLTDQQNRTGTQALTSAHAVRSMLRTWIAGAQLATQGDASFHGASRSALRTDDDEITFVTGTPTDVAAAGTVVRLFVNRNPVDSTSGLVAELRPWRTNGPTRTLLLAAGASGVRVRYLASVFGERTWSSQWTPTPVLPAAVDVQVLFDDSRTADANERASHALLALPLLVPLGSRR